MIKTLLFLCLAILISKNCFAWISSGGELFRDSQNPWFIHNTDTVTYCARVDSKSTSIPSSEVQEAISKAIDYWKSSFKANTLAIKDGTPRAQVATQKFIFRTTCNGKEDIRFLIGHGALEKAETEYLGDLTRFAAVTVRTEYDEVNLKGRGFVYIASDLGPVKYKNLAMPMIESAWSKPGLLYRILIHELGHVFGISHGAIGSLDRRYSISEESENKLDLMDERFPETLLSKKYFKKYMSLSNLDLYFTYPKIVYGHPQSEESRNYLKLSNSEDGIKAETDVLDGFIDLWATQSTLSADQPNVSRYLGRIDFDLSEEHFSRSPIFMKNLIRVRMTDRQRVISSKEFKSIKGVMPGPWFFLRDMQGTLTFGDKTKKKVLVKLRMDGVEVIASENDWILPLW